MPDGRSDAEGAQRPDTANPENDLLLDAGFTIATVETRGQLAVPRRVFGEVGVEQEQPHLAKPDAPDRSQHGAIAERYCREARLPVRGERRLDRRLGPADSLVALFLPALVAHALQEVTLWIHEADADQRHAEVRGFLAVIARQHAEAAGVDRQRLVQREFRGEIRDAAAVEHRLAFLPPRVRLRARLVEAEQGLIVGAQERRIGGGSRQLNAGDALEHANRVVRGRAPQLVVEAAEHLAGLLVPTPPQVDGEFVQAMDAVR